MLRGCTPVRLRLAEPAGAAGCARLAVLKLESSQNNTKTRTKAKSQNPMPYPSGLMGEVAEETFCSCPFKIPVQQTRTRARAHTHTHTHTHTLTPGRLPHAPPHCTSVLPRVLVPEPCHLCLILNCARSFHPPTPLPGSPSPLLHWKALM